MMAKDEYFVCEGLDELISYFDNYMESPQYQKTVKKAIKDGANIVGESIKQSLSTVSDKGYSQGYTVDEVTVGSPKKTDNGYTVKIGWNGPHQRYRLAHLNEFGYSKNGKTYQSPYFGRVAKGIEQSKTNYTTTVIKEIEEGIKRGN